MFLPVDKQGSWNGIRTTLLSFYSLAFIPGGFIAIFEQTHREVELAMFLLGIYGLCNITFILSIFILRARSRIVFRLYRRFLLGASIIAGTSIFWSMLFPRAELQSNYRGVGVYVWPMTFVMLLIGAYQLERDKLPKKELNNCESN
jgi:hypothetical protein